MEWQVEHKKTILHVVSTHNRLFSRRSELLLSAVQPDYTFPYLIQIQKKFRIDYADQPLTVVNTEQAAPLPTAVAKEKVTDMASVRVEV